ncbi:hypothetical protein BC831DRAFT_148234 [Entophlyctis helioformis]|nr:hypothetical protein BC831DRAFT_148234 [Entophlyctis helioformis]
MQTTITSAMHASKIASAESSPSRQPKTDTSHSQSQSLPNTAASGSTASAGSPTLKAEADEPNAKAESPKAKTEPAASTPAKSSFGIQQSSLGFFSSASRSDTHGSGNGSTSSPFASFASSAASGSAFGSATASSESKPFGSGSGSGFTSFASGHASGLSFGSAAAGSSSFASILSTPSSTKSMFGAPKAKTQDSKADRDDAGDDDEGDAEPNEDGDTEEFGKYAQVTLEQKQVVTGEEDETTIHSSRCKLFVWDGENWRERGAGHLRINQKTSSAGSSGHARLVMRADGILRVILNVRIPAGMPHVLRNERFIEILTPEPGNAKPSKLVFRFANSDITSTFFSVLESVIPPSKA